MNWQHFSRSSLAVTAICWSIVVAVPAGADDDDDDDDNSSSPSSIVTTWPPIDVEWPPRLETTQDDNASPTQLPIVVPSGQPSLPIAVATTPTQPIVPTTATVTPSAGG
jgi:hypothetical protein